MEYELRRGKDKVLFFKDLHPGELFLLGGDYEIEKGVFIKTVESSPLKPTAIGIRNGLCFFVKEEDIVKRVTHDKIIFRVED